MNEFDELSIKIEKILGIKPLRDENGSIYINAKLISGILDKIEKIEIKTKIIDKFIKNISSSEEYLKGYEDFFHGKLRSDNPLNNNSIGYEEWDDGWCDASQESGTVSD